MKLVTIKYVGGIELLMSKRTTLGLVTPGQVCDVPESVAESLTASAAWEVVESKLEDTTESKKPTKKGDN